MLVPCWLPLGSFSALYPIMLLHENSLSTLLMAQVDATYTRHTGWGDQVPPQVRPLLTRTADIPDPPSPISSEDGIIVRHHARRRYQQYRPIAGVGGDRAAQCEAIIRLW